MRVPRLDKIVINMALSEARDNVKILDAAVEELKVIDGSEAGHHQGAQGDFELQAARGYADRRDGDAAARAHV